MKYPKIQTIFKRNPDTNYKTLLMNEYSLPEFEYLASNVWLFTEKIDGTNIRVYWDCQYVTFRGRTDSAQIPPFLLKKLREVFPVEKLKETYPDSPMLLYGEGYGARIQKGGDYIPNGVDFILFDVMMNNLWLRWDDIQDIASHLGITTVPMIGQGPLSKAIIMVRNGFQSAIGSQLAEGLVLRPKVDLISRTYDRIITKIKHKDFI